MHVVVSDVSDTCYLGAGGQADLCVLTAHVGPRLCPPLSPHLLAPKLFL